MKRSLALLLILSLLISASLTGQATMPPVKLASAPGVKLFTELEATAAIDAAVEAALAEDEKGDEKVIGIYETSMMAKDKKIHDLETAITVIGIGAAVLIPAAFIGGALAWRAIPR